MCRLMENRKDKKVDIDILLALQDFRNGVGGCLTSFLSKMTFYGELSTAIILMAAIYWAISKEFGTYLLMGWSGNRIVNGFLKVTACAYRPWIRDARIVPYGNSMTTATGYSFPSGHTMNATSVFGGTLLKKDLPGLLRIVAGCIMVLVAFSRIFLGVHTPQDILVGTVAGLVVMGLVMKMMQWLEEHPEKDILVLVIGIACAVAVAVYAAVKPYPVDYDAEGKILVDGAKMANDTFKGVGWCAGFLVGWILEKRFVGFTTEVSMKTRCARICIGLFIYYALTLVLVPLLVKGITGPANGIITSFIQLFYISFLFPWGIKHFEKPEGKAAPVR